MLINEVFYSIQGEGKNIGQTAIFVRFSGCNLNCKWCDSTFARTNKIKMEIDDLAKEIKKYPSCKHLVITGGEPMLQQPAISEIRKKFPDYYIEVETNGSKEAFCFNDVDLFTVSYKTSNSGNKPYKLKTINSKCVYKFVITDRSDFAEVESVKFSYNLPADKIFLMPEGKTKEEVLSKHSFVIEHCKDKGYNFSTRLHILTWGNVRQK